MTALFSSTTFIALAFAASLACTGPLCAQEEGGGQNGGASVQTEAVAKTNEEAEQAKAEETKDIVRQVFGYLFLAVLLVWMFRPVKRKPEEEEYEDEVEVEAQEAEKGESADKPGSDAQS